jgi:hypothetical protein
MLALAEDAGVNHGYLENQISLPPSCEAATSSGAAPPNAGRPHLARASEEHGGPHDALVLAGRRQGGGVLLDDVSLAGGARFLLTDPSRARDSLRLKSASGTVASLKWSRPSTR